MSMKIHHEEHLESALETLDKILQNQTMAMHHITNQQLHSSFARRQLIKSLNLMNSCLLRNGKVVVCGIGKSYKIGAKMCATLNSLGIQAATLHPTEALHGDLGILRKENSDCLVMISSSGKSPEMVHLLQHIPPEVPVVLLTNKRTSTLSAHLQVKSLLFAELPTELSEQTIYGLNAPTISTTLCLALADAVSIALSEVYVSDINERKRIFGERHPGGSIGEEYRSSSQLNSFLNTPNFSTTSLTGDATQSYTANGLTPESDSDGNETRPYPRVEFDFGIDDSIDLEMKESIAQNAFVLHINNFGDELELLRQISVYDFIVVNETHAISTSRVRECIRHVHLEGYSDGERYEEVLWRVKESLVRVQ